jgi:anti-sigma B factor antagonist
MDVHRIDEPQAIRITLAGELDIATVGAAEREIFAAVDEHPEMLLLDLSTLSFMDSTGLRMILAADTAARAAGGRLVLIPGPESVHRVFRLALLEERLEFQGTASQETSG